MTGETTTSVRSFYDRVASGYAQVLPDTAFEAPLDLGMLDQFVSLLPRGAAVLDAGCGTGRMITALQQRGIARVEGVDLSPEMIAIAQRTHPGVRLLLGDLADLPCAPASFDGVLAWYSIIHTPPSATRTVLDGFTRVLRSGGAVLLGFQAGDGERIARGASYGLDGEVRAFLHDPERLASMLEDAGLRVIALAERRPRRTERLVQGFLLAERVLPS